MTVLVIGATGNVGTHVVNALVGQGTATRIITRNPERAAALFPAGVDIIEGDTVDESVLMASLDGVDAVFLLTFHGRDMAEVQLRIIRALRRTTVKIVKLSGTSSAIRPDGPYACRLHWEIEEILKGTGMPHVIVRPNAFMQTMINQIMLPAIQTTGKMPNAVGQAGLSLIDARDIGAVSATVLTKPDWDGQTLVLTGPRAVTFPEIASLIGDIRGRSIETLEITPDDVRVSLIGRGMAEWEAEHFQEMYQVFRNGESSYVTSDVEVVTGRPPRTIEDYLLGEREAFAVGEVVSG